MHDKSQLKVPITRMLFGVNVKVWIKLNNRINTSLAFIVPTKQQIMTGLVNQFSILFLFKILEQKLNLFWLVQYGTHAKILKRSTELCRCWASMMIRAQLFCNLNILFILPWLQQLVHATLQYNISGLIKEL